MYGPAVRCKRFSSIWQMRSCINVSGLCLERVVLRAIMDISAHATLLADRLQRAVGVTSVRMRREDRFLHHRLILSQTSAGSRLHHRWLLISWLFLCSCLAAVPSSRPAGYRRATRRGSQGWPSRRALPLASMLPGHALTALSTARGSRWMGRHRIALIACEGASLVENRPRDAGELVGERNGEHIVV
jgi:hypothetical protein